MRRRHGKSDGVGNFPKPGGFFGFCWGKESKEGELICLSAGYYHLHISLQKFSYHLGTCDPPWSCCKPFTVDFLIPGAKQV